LKLNLIRGAEGAEKILTRIDPLDLSALPQAVLERTHQAFGEDVTPEQSVLKMLQDVRQEGDDAVRRYGKLLDGVEDIVVKYYINKDKKYIIDNQWTSGSAPPGIVITLTLANGPSYRRVFDFAGG